MFATLPTASSFAAATKTCLNAGAAILHLLIRDAQGHHTVDFKDYREVVLAVKEAAHNTMELQVNSEAARIHKALKSSHVAGPAS